MVNIMKDLKNVVKATPVTSVVEGVFPYFDFTVDDSVSLVCEGNDHSIACARWGHEESMVDCYLLRNHAEYDIFEYSRVYRDLEGDSDRALSFDVENGVRVSFKSGDIPSISAINGAFGLSHIVLIDGISMPISKAFEIIGRDYDGEVYLSVSEYEDHEDLDDRDELGYDELECRSYVIAPFSRDIAGIFTYDMLDSEEFCVMHTGCVDFVNDAWAFIKSNSSRSYNGTSSLFEGNYDHGEIVDYDAYRVYMEEGTSDKYTDGQLLAMFNRDPVALQVRNAVSGGLEHTEEFLALK